MSTIPVALRWNKRTFSLSIELGETVASFKQRVQDATGVPAVRQKLMAKKGWKGLLKDGIVLDDTTIKVTASALAVTLVGSAEVLSGPTTKTTFLEDLSPEDLQAAEDGMAQAAMADAHGMIQALQLLPHERDDRKQELYEYNRLVTGMPQKQIEQELKCSNNELQGKVAMTLGLELRRAYVNDIAVLHDGKCVSALDDGHVQLWKHASQVQDAIHQGGNEGGVDSIATFHRRHSPVAFATAGRGSLELWTIDAEPIGLLPGAIPGTCPAGLECVFGSIDDESSDDDSTVTCLASRFEITRQTNPNQFRLPPQNEAERQRRAQAEAQEQIIQEALAKAARSLQVWYSAGTSSSSLQSRILAPPELEGSAPISSLVTLRQSNNQSNKIILAGDIAGGLRLWRVQKTESGLQFHHLAVFQMACNAGAQCAVVCMEALQDGKLAVSTDTSNSTTQLSGATPLPVLYSRAIHILDFAQILSDDHQNPPTVQSSLTGHTTDSVICMCELPNGDLLTGGGKLDATLQLWKRSQLVDAQPHSDASKTLTEVGYVFALAVLPDAKDDSNYLAVAAARYNTVKIII